MFRYVNTPQFIYWPPLEGHLDGSHHLGCSSPVQTNGLVHIPMFACARVSLERTCGTEMSSLSVHTPSPLPHSVKFSSTGCIIFSTAVRLHSILLHVWYSSKESLAI